MWVRCQDKVYMDPEHEHTISRREQWSACWRVWDLYTLLYNSGADRTVRSFADYDMDN